jgi:hypothetical protein
MATKTEESLNSTVLKNLSKFTIDSKSGKIDGTKAAFSKDEHDAETRKSLALNFLTYFFGSLFIFFLLSLVYNLIVMGIDGNLKQLPLLDIANILGLLATTFSSGMGFIFGYYFKGNH